MNDAVNAGLSLATKTARDLTDGRRGTVVGQAAQRGWEVFAGYKIVDGKLYDVTAGAWVGAPWKRWSDPNWGLRAEVRF